MGYNSNCYYQDCYHNCCDFWGQCPSSPNSCYHYYHQRSQTATIIGAVIGSILAVVFVVIVICYCKRRSQQERLQEEIRLQNLNNPGHNQGTTIVLTNPQIHGQPYQQKPPYGEPYQQNPPYGQPIAQPAYYGNPAANPGYYGQPVMGQPIYHQPNNP